MRVMRKHIEYEDRHIPSSRTLESFSVAVIFAKRKVDIL